MRLLSGFKSNQTFDALSEEIDLQTLIEIIENDPNPKLEIMFDINYNLWSYILS